MQDILEREPQTESNPSQREGSVARTIEQQTAKLPSDTFLWAAVGSVGLSLTMMAIGQEKKANFIGQWAPTLLILGLYNKMVKLHGPTQLRVSQRQSVCCPGLPPWLHSGWSRPAGGD
jgi:hypothetical protein